MTALRRAIKLFAGPNRRARWRLGAVLGALCLSLASVACGSQSGSGGSADAGTAAASTHHTCVAGATRTTLAKFESVVGFKVNCADIYDDSAPTWNDWDHPWFIDNHIAEDNWTPFAANPKNQLIITLTMIPDSVLKTDWRSAGATGKYTQYAKVLARNLVKAHMGSSVIRLGTEANGTWEKDSITQNAAQNRQWAQFWAKTAQAMKSVPGAHFVFNWAISNGYRDIPFSQYYPGNQVVDQIGVDDYDQAPSGTKDRFAYEADQSGGLKAIAAFAKKQGKPLTVPEWGLDTTQYKGIGDDPSFVKEMAVWIASSPVVSESYFFDGGSATALEQAPQSLKIFKSAFNPSTGSVVAKQ